jgi:hypothetical protein
MGWSRDIVITRIETTSALASGGRLRVVSTSSCQSFTSVAAGIDLLLDRLRGSVD